MEDQAPYYPAPPRNLAPELATWLRERLGFSCSVQAYPTLHVLTAGWSGPGGEHFELTYTWQAGPSADATLQMRVLLAQPTLTVDTLFTAQRVRRLAQARQLVNGCVRLHNARLRARQPLATTTC